MQASGHTVLITGGAAGIGKALAEQFIRHGNKLIVVGRSEQKLSELKAQYPQIVVLPCNLGREQERQQLVERLYRNYPTISVLINNAGIQMNYSFLEGEPEERQQQIHEEITVNFTAPLSLTAALLPLLARQREAAVINVSSGLALVPKQSAPVYCATKAGIHQFTKALRYQLEATPVRVFEIIPPIVDTDMTRGRGRGKITAEALAAQFWSSYCRDQLEVRIGKVELLVWLNRFFPAIAERLLKNS